MTKQAPPPPNHREGRAAETISPIPTLLPGGGVTMLSGATGIGKTAFTAKLVKAIIDGTGKFLGADVQATCKKVGLICTDRNWKETRYWYNKAGVEEGEQFEAYCLQDDYGVNWKQFIDARNHLDLLNKYLDLLALPPHGVVIIDPISPFLGSNLNDYSKTFAAISPVNQAMAKRQLTSVGLHHVMKMRGDPKDQYLRPQDRILGSTAIASFTNTQIYVVGPEEKKVPYYTIGFVPHNAKSQEFKFGRDENGLFIPWVDGQEAAGPTPIEGTDEDLTAAYNALKEIGPTSASDHNERLAAYFTAKGITKSKRQIERYREELVKRNLIYSPSKGVWMRETSRPKEEEQHEAQ